MASHVLFWLALLFCEGGCRARLTVVMQTSHDLPVMGNDVTIRCTYSPPSGDSVIKWRHGNTMITFTQRTTANPFRSSITTKFKFMRGDHSTSLTINYLNTEDNGNYSCTVLTAVGYISSSMTLQVLNPAPPSDLFISDDRSPMGYPDNPYISMETGEPRDITCTVRGARPPALIEWRTDAEHIRVMDQINDVKGQSYISRRVATITTSKVDHNRIIRCLASHRDLQNVLQATIRLYIPVLPTEIRLSASFNITNLAKIPTLVVYQNVPAVITCTCGGSRPVAILFWELGDTVVTDGITSFATPNSMDKSLLDAESMLRLVTNVSHHYKLVRCLAPAGQNQVHAEVRLVVYGPPDTPQMSGTGDLQAGMSASVKCIANNAYPAPVFQWNLGTTDLTNESATDKELNEYNRMSAGSLLTFTPKKSDHGQYLVCEVFQAEAQPSWSRSVRKTIEIAYPPVIVDLSVRRSLASNGRMYALFACQVDARPHARIFEWFFNGSRLENDTKIAVHQWYFQETVTTSTLMIINPKVTNEGNYKCLTRTSLGNDSAAIYSSLSSCRGELQASIAAKDLPVTGEDIQLSCLYSLLSSSFLLKWKTDDFETLASLDCLDIMSDCEPSNSNSSKFILRTDSRSFNLTIKDLTMDDSGIYECKVIGLAGLDEAAVELDVLSRTPPNVMFISDESSQDDYASSPTITMTADIPYNIFCTSLGARPPVLLEWQIPTDVHVLIRNQSNHMQGDSYVSRRVVTVIPTKDDHGQVLTCSVPDHNAGLHTTTRLDVQVPPANLQIQAVGHTIRNETGTALLTIFEHTLVTIICRSLGSRPVSSISWTIGIRSPTQETFSASSNSNDDKLFDSGSGLELRPDRMDHYKCLRCTATAGNHKSESEIMFVVDDLGVVKEPPPQIKVHLL